MQNFKALFSVKLFINQIYSYLEADITKPEFNRITTIPTKNRSDKNGWANFQFQYVSKFDIIEQLKVRVETSISTNKDTLSIRPSYAEGMKNADLIIFIDKDQERLFIADKKINKNNAWLNDKNLRKVSTPVVMGKTRAVYEYNIESLLRSHALFEICTENNSIHIAHDDLYSYFTGRVMKLDSDTKEIEDYGTLGTEHITEVQYDAKDRDTVFFGTVNEEIITRPATLLGIADMCIPFTDLNKDAIYQRLFRALKNGVKFELPTKNATEAIKNLLNDKGNIELYLSYEDKTVIEKRVNKTANMKEYKKVAMWIKRNPGKTDFPKKWTEEQKELFYKLFNKNN